jgi:GalNAc-alpha-(1->4)-GalNAc-alpha-(1->3)-diNAcBac-PP-undecaprenol alpha-1,4-N-acetyl-D-galactosaminyltransferase
MAKILVVANSRQPGGAEKSAIKLANALGRKHDVTFSTLTQSNLDFYSPPETEVIDFLEVSNAMRLFLPRFVFKVLLPLFFLADLLFMRRSIQKSNFDLVISFGAGVGCVTYLSLVATQIPQITSERISPDKKVYRPSLLARILRPWIYNHGVLCSVQSDYFRSVTKTLWGIESYVTPNHFDIPEDTFVSTSSLNPCVAVGRPAHQKGYDILIKAWALLEKKIENELLIVANDSEGFIQELISEAGAQKIRVIPLTNNLNQLYANCSLFISTARFEGFPNALAEAIIYGIPTLTTASSDVVFEWCEKGLCLKIPSLEPTQVAHVIEKALGRPDDLDQVSQRAILHRKDFSWERVEQSWEKIITAALNNRSNTN